MENEISLGSESLPTILKDPFKKNHVVSISVYYRENTFSEGWCASGSVKFKNGDTNGEQAFKGEHFDEVVGKIKNFITNELK